MKTFKNIIDSFLIIEKESIKPVKYNLQKKYDYFNKLLFDNRLPKIPLKFVRSKKYGGMVRTFYWYANKRKTRVERFEYDYLALSTFSLRTESEFDMILCHEMIHVWMQENGYHEGVNVKSHGNEYVTKRNEIQSKVGFEIPLKDYLEVNIRNKKIGKEYGFVTAQNAFGSAIAVIKKEILEENIDRLKAMFERGGESGTTYTFGTTKNPELEQYKIKRTIKSIEMFYMKDSVKKSLEEDQTVIYSFEKK